MLQTRVQEWSILTSVTHGSGCRPNRLPRRPRQLRGGLATEGRPARARKQAAGTPERCHHRKILCALGEGEAGSSRHGGIGILGKIGPWTRGPGARRTRRLRGSLQRG
jgi:hypothetical protein